MEADNLQKIRCIADYQFGRGVGAKLFPDTVKIEYSKNTGKIRHIHFEEEMLATLQPTTGLFVLTIAGARRMVREVNPLMGWVRIQSDVESFISKGRSTFAKHVTEADEKIKPNEEVIVVNSKNEVLAVGRALLSGTEMKAFSRGIAVRVRRGATEKS